MKEPRFRDEDLRDCGAPAAVERVWQRLEEELDAPAKVKAGRPPVAWALVIAGATFGLGLWVGQGLDDSSRLQQAAVHAEPPPSVEPASMQAPLHPRQSSLQAPLAEHPSRGAQKKDHPSRRVRHAPAIEAEPAVTGDPADSFGVDALEPLEPAPVVEAIKPPEPPRWQRLANGGEYEAALEQIGQVGGFEAALASADPEQLMLLADVARATGQRQRALASLRRIVVEFRDSQTAPLAAFSLGNMLERSGDARGAAEAFAVYRSLSPRGDFAEDALLRELRSAVERDERARARELLAQYESDFPEARHGDEVESLRERLLGAATASDAGAPTPETGDEPAEEPTSDAPEQSPNQ